MEISSITLSYDQNRFTVCNDLIVAFTFDILVQYPPIHPNDSAVPTDFIFFLVYYYLYTRCTVKKVSFIS